ncbi:RNA polymerase sigma factor [Qipengyuania sphaerica]|uniref:RNA polymerase sigma factor n=1 Tax=Qipengyuania sphaerica TaxID=2867243 RepID=UPI001C886E24|nr:sigma-70 family RNA polymerase sigma factor [Qipengyuania sphaerica]MBX7540716.1 sigma-70 family RNA polymerase sigma factor [Qipengyuania sphaerica]
MTGAKQHDLYREAGEQFAPAIARLARAMERDPDKARDLEQDIHCELFRSFARFDGRCSLKTWVYRVSHNVAAEHRLRESRRTPGIPLDEIDDPPEPTDTELAAAESLAIARAQAMIRRLPTLDAQVMLLWLEGESGKEIAEVTGLGAANVATRIHRLKALLADKFNPETPS